MSAGDWGCVVDELAEVRGCRVSTEFPERGVRSPTHGRAFVGTEDDELRDGAGVARVAKRQRMLAGLLVGCLALTAVYDYST